MQKGVSLFWSYTNMDKMNISGKNYMFMDYPTVQLYSMAGKLNLILADKR